MGSREWALTELQESVVSVLGGVEAHKRSGEAVPQLC